MPLPDLEAELDRHGASLRALAVALLGNGADADDAVQETYARAMAQPPSTPGPLGGWLHRVLRHEAFRLRRRRARQQRREAVAARPESVPAADAQLAQRETLRLVIEAVFALAEPYRHVVKQRFFEGHKPAAIAAMTGEPLATVKSRLQRGLQLLREQLDGGERRGDWRGALSGAFGIEGAGALAGAALTTGVLLMGSGVKLAIGGGVAAIAVAATLMWSQGGAPVVAPVRAPSYAAQPQQGEVVAKESASTQRREVQADPVVAAADLAHIRGRCIAVEDQQPLPGCTVKINGRDGNQNLVAMRGKLDWRDPTPVVTGADGCFDMAFAPPISLRFDLEVSAPGRTPRTHHWTRLAPKQLVDFGDIQLTTGFDVRGRVVDEQGLPVADVSVLLRGLPLPLLDSTANDARVGLSAADGTFQVDAPIPAGRFPLDVSARGRRLLAPDKVTVDPVRGAEPLTVVLRSMPSIAGIVVDEQGAPVAGVAITADLGHEGRMAGSSSEKDGTFTIYAVDAEPKPVWLRVDNPGPCEPGWHNDRPWEWGSKDVRIELKRALSFELTVVERGTDSPVTQYAVSCYHARNGSSSRFRNLRLTGEHAQGRVTVDRVWRGTNMLTVLPVDPALRPSGILAVEGTDAGVAPLRVELERMQPASVRVCTSAGAAVAGAKVEVIAIGARPLGIEELAEDPRLGSGAFSIIPVYRVPELLSSGTTDGEGRAKLLVPASLPAVSVRVIGESHPRALVTPVQFVNGQEVVVTVADGGGLACKVQLADLVPTRVSVKLIQVQGQRREQVMGRGFDDGLLDAAGRYTRRGLVPGQYEIELWYSIPYRSDRGGQPGGMQITLPRTEAVVQAGSDTDVVIDATSIATACVRGRVLLDGAPPSAARVFLQAGTGGSGPRVGQFVPAEDGSFEATGLLPGSYVLGLVVGDFAAGDGDSIMQDDTLALTAGQQLVRDFTFVRRRLVVRIVKADGTTPAAKQQFSCMSTGLTGLPRTTDAEGRLVFDPAPRGPFRLQPLAGTTMLDPIEMPIDKTEHEVTLKLPAAK